MSTILLLDDDPLQIKLLSRQLNNLGMQKIAGYERALEALEALEALNTEVTLLFLDLNMPDMDGIEVLRLLAERGYQGVLALVSGEDPRILETAVRLARTHGINVIGALAKPCEPTALAALVETWRFFVQPSHRQTKRAYSPEAVRRAIEHGEMVNFYQPKVRLADGALVGVETLVRWRHPQDGLVFPDQFIRVAEEHGFINALTRVVLTAALAQAKSWRDEGLSLDVAVNVSMDDLVDLDFPQYVLAALNQHDGSPAYLTLEITESRLVKDMRTPMDILARLRLKRIKLSIDDFGTGHSSLAQLRDLPFDELKIDRSFVHDAVNNHVLRAIFKASLDMAQQLNMKTVAEGVEDRADWDWLREQGCDLAQGYFIAKPLSADDFSAWLRESAGRRQQIDA